MTRRRATRVLPHAIVVLGLLALVARAAIPAGFMPVDGRLQFCPGHAGGVSGHAGRPAPSGGKACPFALGAHGHAPAPATAGPTPVLAAAGLLVPRPTAAPGDRPTRPPLGARGPPANA
jgi:hypothetical protein